jgi:hypothetical protein
MFTDLGWKEHIKYEYTSTSRPRGTHLRELLRKVTQEDHLSLEV